MSQPLILLTGATGYVGGRLLHRLEAAGTRVRCLVRDPQRLRARAAAGTELVAGDVLAADSLPAALAGVDTAYYLVHAMAGSAGFAEQDRRAAHNFAAAARAAGVRRIVYLGGLGRSTNGLSAHLASRQEVGAILRASGVQTIEFRASIVIGSGSLSFELVRALTERLPVMICPRWVRVPAQPIAIQDLLDYLCAARDWSGTESAVFEIGGADVVSYAELMREYARQRGLRRLLIRVPVLTPRLSSLWLGLVTPLYARVGRILVDSIRHPTVVEDPRAARVFALRPMGMRDAIAAALRNEDEECAQTRWSDALVAAGRQPEWGGIRFGNRIVDSRAVRVAAPAAAAFAPIRRIGGARGWYAADFLWRMRGFLDLLCGGVGLRRGRRDPEHLAVGDVLDWWRVEAFEPDRFLRLRAEMRLPGRAWLEFSVAPAPAGTTIRQTAIFDPAGIAGLAYWYALYPLHLWIFARMLRAIARQATA
ncbi:MAG: DUF2867 domain-containing protein [Planctomycetes bacterium]|nr:DUF2867 domain-containing protein [Planctomycetota bacterium]